MRGASFMRMLITSISHQSPSNHKEHLKLLLERLNQYGIMISSVKCVFVPEITFLGYAVNNNEIKFPAQCVKAIRNFHRRFIP